MRPAAMLSIAASLSAIAAAVAGAPVRPSRPSPLPSPPTEQAPADQDIAVLRAPGPDAILIRTSAFLMGSNEIELDHALMLCRAEPGRDSCSAEKMFGHEYPPHEVLVTSYWIDRTEVTVARYGQCVAAGRCAAPPYASGGERFNRPHFPVTLVTWSEAVTFCKWAGGRLPTEAEWERAARGIARRRFPWGNVWNPNLANHGRFGWNELDADDGFLELAPAGSFPDGRTPDGLDDLGGNVAEWVADWYAPEYPQASAVNPRGPDLGEERVARGGSYIDGRPWVRGAARNAHRPAMRFTHVGFRCARDP